MAGIIPGIFDIYTFLEKNIPDIYNRVGATDSNSSGNYALIAFSKSDKKEVYKNFRNITTYSDGKNRLKRNEIRCPRWFSAPYRGFISNASYKE